MGGRLGSDSSLLSSSQEVPSKNLCLRPCQGSVADLVAHKQYLTLPGNKLVASHVPPHNRHTLFKQIVVDLSHGPSDTFAYLSDFASGRVLTFRWRLIVYHPHLASAEISFIVKVLMCSLKSGKSWAVQTEETQPANNQFPVGRSNILFSDQASLGQIFALDQQKKILKPP